jgi:putative ABC transport system permease protein
VDVLLQDLKFALRSLRRTPGYTAIVIAVMALGIGLNTMVFSMVYGVLYRPMPLPEPQKLVYMEHWNPKRHDDVNLSYTELREMRTRLKTVEYVGAWWDHNAFVTIGKEPERYYGTTMTHDLFATLGVQPILGTAFTADDEVWGKNWSKVLISYRVWKSRYAGDPGVLGKTLRLNGRTRTIVGVMPAGFTWPENQDFWIPMGFDPNDEKWDSFQLVAAGRLKSGVSPQQANAEMNAMITDLRRDHPKEFEGLEARVLPYKKRIVDDIRPMMLLLQSAVAFVLLIACANVANLMLARSAARRREISLRMALGASRTRIVRQLLTESIAVAGGGAALGILLAQWGQRMWISMVPLEMPMWLKFQLDTPVLLFTVGVTVVAGLLFGFAPAMHATDARLNEALREGSSQAGSSRGGNRLRSALVVAEVALSLVLLVGAGLMIRSFMKRYDLENHLRVDGVLTGSVLLPFATYPEPQQRVTFYHELTQQIAALPGVEEVSATNNLPLGRNRWGKLVHAESDKDFDQRRAPAVNYSMIFPGYFHLIGVPLRSGRDFNLSDTPQSQRVAIVNESMAKKLWPKEDALGKRFKFVGDPDSVGWATVVGVCGDVVQSLDSDEARPEQAYVPHDQDPYQMMALMVRSTSQPAALAAKIRSIIQSRDPDQVLVEPRTFREHVKFSMWMHRLFSSLFGTFAVIALLIAGIGLYGVMAYSVTQRTQEIGIRMALGADGGSVVRMVTIQAMRLTILGIGIGLAGAFAVTRVMAAQLFKVSPTDPPTFTVVCLLLVLSGVTAAWLPALRASRVNPVVALRYE